MKNAAMYSVHLLYENGRGSYLSVKGRSKWKTRRIATEHAKDIAAIKSTSGAMMSGLVAVEVENEFGETLESFKREAAQT